MKSKRNAVVRLLAAGLTVATLSTVLAHGGATGIVKERMDAMSQIGKAVKSLAGMFKGEIKYDADTVKAAAGVMRGHSGDNLTRLFPEGSKGGASEAKAEIWQNWTDFQRLANNLQTYSSALAAAADKGNGATMPNSSTMMGNGNSRGGMMGSGNSRGGMMGSGNSRGGMMGGGMTGPTREMLAEMPPRAIFAQVARTCNACHTRYRQEKK